MIETTLIDWMGSDLSVVNAARVSFGKKSNYEWKVDPDGDDEIWLDPVLNEKDQKLIKYLGEHGHYSPFGHCFASFHVKAPIFVARQLVKHKFLRWNEISRRYVEDVPEFYPQNFRKAVKDKKQGSGDYVGDEQQQRTWCDFDNVHVGAMNAYLNALDEGVAPEQARAILPQTLMTEWYWSGSLDAFANMCNLRCKEDTQYESRLVANQIDEEMAKLFPHSWKALRNVENNS